MIKKLLAFVCGTLAASGAHAEACKVHSSSSTSEGQITTLDLDLAQPAKLNPHLLPDGTDSIMCLRPSIIPQPSDVRVITELGVSFGITEDGTRALWIYATAGQLRTRVDDGKLTRGERFQLKDWLKSAQRRFVEALAERG